MKNEDKIALKNKALVIIDNMFKDLFPKDNEAVFDCLREYITLTYTNLIVKVGDEKLSSQEIIDAIVIPEMIEMINDICKGRGISATYRITRKKTGNNK